MRAKMIAAGAVLLLIALMCWYSNTVVRCEAEAMRALSNRVEVSFGLGDRAEALAAMDLLQQRLDESRQLLEVLTLHEIINLASSHMVEARAYLETDEYAQFLNAIRQLNEDLTILYEQQKLSWSNLF